MANISLWPHHQLKSCYATGDLTTSCMFLLPDSNLWHQWYSYACLIHRYIRLLQKYVSTIHIKISRCVIFMPFMVKFSFTKFSSSKFHSQKFGLQQLESRIHMNNYIWCLQAMMASLQLIICSHWGDLGSGYCYVGVTTLFNSFYARTIVDSDIFESDFDTSNINFLITCPFK